nr:MAG TPA: hypothetical protein [Bacteriophage sp.]
MKVKDLTGQRFGRLIVVRRYEHNLICGNTSRAHGCVCVIAVKSILPQLRI